jgi:hypothetical protein
MKGILLIAIVTIAISPLALGQLRNKKTTHNRLRQLKNFQADRIIWRWCASIYGIPVFMRSLLRKPTSLVCRSRSGST